MNVAAQAGLVATNRACAYASELAGIACGGLLETFFPAAGTALVSEHYSSGTVVPEHNPRIVRVPQHNPRIVRGGLGSRP